MFKIIFMALMLVALSACQNNPYVSSGASPSVSPYPKCSAYQNVRQECATFNAPYARSQETYNKKMIDCLRTRGVNPNERYCESL